MTLVDRIGALASAAGDALKAAIARVTSLEGRVEVVPITHDDYDDLDPEEQADPTKLYAFTDDE